MTLTATERVRKFRQQRKDNGLCVLCGKELDRKGIRCISCNNELNKYNRDTRAWRLEHRICPKCGKNDLFGDEKSCQECSAKSYEVAMKSRKKKGTEHYNRLHAEWQRKEYERRKENGICGRCGKRNADYGYKSCGICREKDRNHKRIKYASTKRKEWIENGLCFFCGEVVKPGYKVCENHYQSLLDKLDNDKAKEATEKIKQSNKIFYVKKSTTHSL